MPIERYNWTTDDGRMILEIYTDREHGMAPHKFSINYHPDELGKWSKITDDERKKIRRPNVSGPSEDVSLDTTLRIDKDYGLGEGYLPVFFVHFLNGKFQYGEIHDVTCTGAGDLNSLHDDVKSVEDFREKIKEYFGMSSYDEFSDFFARSDLPETYTGALKDIL